MGNKVEILDSIMGSGKSTALIKWMVERPYNKYLYVSPLLSEVEERIPIECESLGFVSPNTNDYHRKSDHLLHLLEQGMNISFSHTLFEQMTKEHLKWVQAHSYVLIIDEEIDFIEPYQGKDFKKEDITTLEKSGYIKVDEKSLGRIDWTWDEDKFDGGAYQKLKNMAELQMLYCAKRSRQMLVVHLPSALINSASRCIVATYMFENSVMEKFMLMKGFEIVPFTEVQLMYTEAEIKKRASNNIEIIRTPTMGKVSRMSLSGTWYSVTADKKQLSVVAKAISSVCRTAEKKSEVMFTFPAGLRRINKTTKNSKSITITGYEDERDDKYWVACNTKATNSFSHKKVLIHAFNRYPMVSVSSYLQDYGFPLDEDGYALSELIQWIWRSNIRLRDGNIKIAFLSLRMERLFREWVNEG